MNPYFDHKVVWITGASSGIGEALAIEMNLNGATVILSGRNIDNLLKVQSKLSQPNNSFVIILDMTVESEIDAVVKKVMDTHHKVDILINNAGRSQRSKILDTKIEVYRELMEVNYFGVISITKKILPFMITNGGGQIIVISSLAGKVGAPLRSGYSASKHALHGFFDCLRVEHEKDKVKVNLICPGYTKTNIAFNAINEKGEPFKKPDSEIENGMEPKYLAHKILEAAEKNIMESYIGGSEVKSIFMKRFFPKILHRILVKRNK